MKTINLFFDFKFTSLSPDAQPISLGIVSDEKTTCKEYPVGIVSWDKSSAIALAKLNGLDPYSKKECILLYRPDHFCGWVFSKLITHDAIVNKVDGYGLSDMMKRAYDYEKEQVVENTKMLPKSFYAEFSDFDLGLCDDWVKKNVVEKLKFSKDSDGLFHKLRNIEFGENYYFPEFECRGSIYTIKGWLKKWLSQFSNYNIQFVCDCGTFDWYWMLQLLVEWDELEFEIVGREPIYDMLNKRNIFLWTKKSSKCTYIIKTGLPKLPDNISPVPFDLNDLIAIRKGITPREAFDIERLGTFCVDNDELYNNVPNTHNALFDARVIKETYNKLK